MKWIRSVFWPFLGCVLSLAWMLFSGDRFAETARSFLGRHLDLPVTSRSLGKTVPLSQRLTQKGYALGQPVLLRLFKSESRLELWMQRGPEFELAMSFAICTWSGALGPKQKEGDRQSPEGFYEINSKHLKLDSDYYRAINIGYPNAYDRSWQRSGSFLMIHGSCVSIGCYAMTDAGIDDIYNLVEAALRKGQKQVQIQIFPFEMTEANLSKHQNNPWAEYWRNLAEGDQTFLASKQPLSVKACGKRYAFDNTLSAGCEKVESW